MAIIFLPFDHRNTFVRDLLGKEYPADKKTAAEVIKLKKIVYDGFLQVWRADRCPSEFALLVDEEFGTAIIKDAIKREIITAVSVEKSGQTLLKFEYGADYQTHLKNIRPDFAKVLVRYDTRQTLENKMQAKKILELSKFCSRAGLGLMVELLTAGPGNKKTQVSKAIKELTAVGVIPCVWKIEGLDTAKDWLAIRKLTRADLIVLGRGENEAHVKAWITTAAQSNAACGFAIGRTVFYKPLEQFIKGKIDREQAVTKIAKNFEKFVKLWRKYA